jgi:hypothetical protein
MDTALAIAGLALIVISGLGFVRDSHLVRVGHGPFGWRLASGFRVGLDDAYFALRLHPVFVIGGALGLLLLGILMGRP